MVRKRSVWVCHKSQSQKKEKEANITGQKVFDFDVNFKNESNKTLMANGCLKAKKIANGFFDQILLKTFKK